MINIEKSFFKMSYRRRMSIITSFKIVRAILVDFTRKDDMKLHFHFQTKKYNEKLTLAVLWKTHSRIIPNESYPCILSFTHLQA